jgi:multiple sugar transport system permease protein
MRFEKTLRDAVKRWQRRGSVSAQIRAIPRLWRKALAYSLLSIWAVCCIGPLYWIASNSLQRPVDTATGPRYLPFLDFEPTLHGWRLLAEAFPTEIAGPFLTTIELSFAVTALTLVIALPAAYALCRWRRALPVTTLAAAVVGCAVIGLPAIGLASWLFAIFVVAIAAIGALASRHFGPMLGPATVMIGLLVPRIVPPIVIALPLYQLLWGTGMLASWTGAAVADVVVGIPIAVWLLRGYIVDVPLELDEAARIDGARLWQVLWSVVVPLIRPGLCATALLVFALCWNEYLFGVYLTAGGADTLPAYLAGQIAVREQMASAEPQGSFFSALIIVSVLPPIGCAVMLDRLARRTAATLMEPLTDRRPGAA